MPLCVTVAPIVTQSTRSLCSCKQILVGTREANGLENSFQVLDLRFRRDKAVSDERCSARKAEHAHWFVYILRSGPLVSASMKSLQACRLHWSSCCSGPRTFACRSVDQIRSLEMFQSHALNSEIIFSGTSASVPCKWALALYYANYWAYVRKCLFWYQQMLKMPRLSAGAEVGLFWLLAVVLMAWTRLERVTEILWLSR